MRFQMQLFFVCLHFLLSVALTATAPKKTFKNGSVKNNAPYYWPLLTRTLSELTSWTRPKEKEQRLGYRAFGGVEFSQSH